MRIGIKRNRNGPNGAETVKKRVIHIQSTEEEEGTNTMATANEEAVSGMTMMTRTGPMRLRWTAMVMAMEKIAILAVTISTGKMKTLCTL